jgi:hypothetical protein
MWIRWWSNKPAPLSAVMKHVFLNVFIKIISIQVRRHNAGDNALSGHYHHCITVQVTLTFAQL